MKFDWFVVPFLAGLSFVFIYIIVAFYKWIQSLHPSEKKLLLNHLFSIKIWKSIKEIFYECLLHRKIFKTNRLLGYMHSSLALGWFLLIVLGNIEVKFYSEYSLNPPYVPIFLKFFETNTQATFFAQGFKFVMDFLLLIILSGVALATFKRYNASTFGMIRTNRPIWIDRVALISLWCIFPARLLAESFSAGLHQNGSFLTNSLGNALTFLPLENLEYPAWWFYSIVLGVFFVILPFSRYMHIPTEVLLILYRNAGIKANKFLHSYQQVEIHACSRCGMCIDSCQLSNLNYSIQPSYYLRDIRYQKFHDEKIVNCLLCGRCNISCPVGINSSNIRLFEKHNTHDVMDSNYSFINFSQIGYKTDIIYFGGCMTHLTPSIIKAMKAILDNSQQRWKMLDADETICCGRPLWLSGQKSAALKLMNKVREKILSLRAKILITSCPICYKTFKHDYELPITVMHHTQWIEYAIKTNILNVYPTSQKVYYHDPCELSRDLKVYEEPRRVLQTIANLQTHSQQKDYSFCCGGSLANTYLSYEEKDIIAAQTINQIMSEPDATLITSCPLCKKSFEKHLPNHVKDIAEIVAYSMIHDSTRLKSDIEVIESIMNY